MNKILRVLHLPVPFFSLILTATAMAADGAPTATPSSTASPSPDRKPHPCFVVHQACLAAGYAPGKSKDGKGLVKNCIQPLMENQPVTGVTVDPVALAACKEKRKNLKMNRKGHGRRHRGGGDASNAGGSDAAASTTTAAPSDATK